MLISHIPSPINFYSIPECKYENCITREEHERQLAEDRSKQENNPDANGYMRFNLTLLNDTGNELFAGDKIIGYYSDGNTHSLCLYEWKRNNSRRINAYSPLLKVDAGELIDDEIQLISTPSMSERALSGMENRRKMLLTL